MKKHKHILIFSITICLFFIVISYVLFKYYSTSLSSSKKISNISTNVCKHFQTKDNIYSNYDSNNSKYNKSNKNLVKIDPKTTNENNSHKEDSLKTSANSSEFNIDIGKLHCLNNSKQVILVTTSSFKTYKAKIYTYEKKDAKWVRVHGPYDAVIGMNGFSLNKREGDKCSPVGAFSIVTLFGWCDNHPFKMPYRKTTPYDYWVSNRTLKEYNVWITYKGDPKKRFYDYENLSKQPLYKYAAILNYNYGTNKIMDKGSGIFFHLRPTSGKGTLGCTGTSEKNIFTIFKWLDPNKNPIVIEGPIDTIKKM